MTSFFGKLKSGTGATSPSIGSPSKKDGAGHPQTPLERMLLNAGPIRQDGSDKFFGMENFGNTCYCNSILQCLYYSVPFREHVLNYPTRSPLNILREAATNALPRPPFNLQLANGGVKKPGPLTTQRNLGSPPTTNVQKPDDKESPDYKKKHALMTGPVLNMSYQNAAGYDMQESLFTALKDIFEAILVNDSRIGVISPARFLEVLRRENEMFRSAMHQDAHEFLNLLLNTVVENVEAYAKKVEADKADDEKKSSENGDVEQPYSPTVSFPMFTSTEKSGLPSTTRWVHELFEGTLTSETRCLTCENVSQRDEPFLDLSVDLDQHSSVTSCLRRFSEEEMLCERNKFHCDNCGGLQEAEKRMKIKRLPRILALHLKRFKYTEDLQRLQKLFHKVVYPYHLRLFNTTDDAEDPDRLYELYAVVVHIGGGPYHGHYVAIIKTEDRGWLLFDDEMVEPVDKGFVRNFFGDRPGLACAYVLFYQETTEEAIYKEEMDEEKIRKSVEETVGLGVMGNGSAEMHRVISPPTSPLHTERFANLDHAVSAPVFAPNLGPEILKLPTAPPTQIARSKKDLANEEKERKAVEREREKVEKQRQKELSLRMKEVQKRLDVDVKPAETVQDATNVTESTNKENTTPNGSALAGLDRFRRSKSLRFSSLGRRDKPPDGTVDDPPSGSTTDQSLGKENSKEKKTRFGIRKRSFGMLS